MLTPGRPTARCLRQDLDTDWDNAGHQRIVVSLEESPVPLHRLDHRIIRKAAEDFPASGDSEVKRESITGLSDPMWWKVRIGARWRGAVYVDSDGQAWLCAAGYRREGEAADFYKHFMASIEVGGPDQYLPTQEDRNLLSDEVAQGQFEAWEAGVQEQARDLANEARGSGLVTQMLLGPRGAALAEITASFDVVTEDGGDEGLADFYIEFSCLDWSSAELLDWAESVMLTTINEREQDWQVSHVKDGRAYSLLLPTTQLGAFFAAMELPRTPGACVPGDHSHYAHTARLVQSTIEGQAVKALCGIWFVPRQDHVPLSACARCDMILRRLPD